MGYGVSGSIPVLGAVGIGSIPIIPTGIFFLLGVAEWLKAADCKSVPCGSLVRIQPPSGFFLGGIV